MLALTFDGLSTLKLEVSQRECLYFRVFLNWSRHCNWRCYVGKKEIFHFERRPVSVSRTSRLRTFPHLAPSPLNSRFALQKTTRQAISEQRQEMRSEKGSNLHYQRYRIDLFSLSFLLTPFSLFSSDNINPFYTQFDFHLLVVGSLERHRQHQKQLEGPIAQYQASRWLSSRVMGSFRMDHITILKIAQVQTSKLKPLHHLSIVSTSLLPA